MNYTTMYIGGVKHPKKKPFTTVKLPTKFVEHVRGIAEKEGRFLYSVILDRFPELKVKS